MQRLDHTSRLFYNLRILKVPDTVQLRTAIIMLFYYYIIINLLPKNVQVFQQVRVCLYSQTRSTFYTQLCSN